MAFLTNLASLVVAGLVFFSFSSFGIVLLKVPQTVEQAKDPVWKIKSPSGEGVGFFVDSKRFVTDFETAAIMLTGNNTNAITLSQNQGSTVRVKRLLSLDAHGLALFETEPVEGYLNIAEDWPGTEDDLLIPTYLNGEFAEIKNSGNVFFSKSGLYSFFINEPDRSVKRMQGSPVLNTQGDIAGVVLRGGKAVLILSSTYLKQFVAENKYLNCSDKGVKNCIRDEMDFLKRRAYGDRDALSQYLLALMYFHQTEQNWWLEWNRKPEHESLGSVVFLGSKQFGYQVRQPSLMQRNNMQMLRHLTAGRKKAFELLFSAAGKGLPEALYYLATKYYLKEDSSSEEEWAQNLPGTFNLVSEAAEQGFYIAQHFLAILHLTGVGTDKDPQKALEWMNKAADQKFIVALERLAELHEGNNGVKKDSAKIVEYRTRAADLGSTESEYKLADMYLNGIEVGQDLKKASELFTRAAEKGLSAAQYQLGIMHYQGKGVQRNPLQASRWIRQAAKNGFTEAQHFLQKQPCPFAWH